MPVNKPYKRTIRQLVDDSYSNSGNSDYIDHHDYAKSPEKFIRSFLLIQNDIKKLFEYVEPVDKNKEAYSYRIHELFVRVCIEVEANCRAILCENGYKKEAKYLNMGDYRLIEKTHRLSKYKVVLPRWEGKLGSYNPFREWAKEEELHWYDHYHSIKHDIHTNFKHANIKNLIEATCGLVALLSAQFLNKDFSSEPGSLEIENLSDGMKSSVGGYFLVDYPDWDRKDRYNFEWQSIKNEPNIIQCHDYNSMAKKKK